MAHKQCHFKVFRSNDFLFFCSLYSATYTCCWFIATLIDNTFMNSVEFVTVSGNLLCQLADHLLQFLVLKDFRVSYRPKHEQIFKRNYRFFNNNEFKNEINQIDWKTLFDSHDMNLCFGKFLHNLTCVFDDYAPIKKLSKKEKSLIDKP